MTKDEKLALERFVADGNGTTTNRKKPHKDWNEIIKKGRAEEALKNKK